MKREVRGWRREGLRARCARVRLFLCDVDGVLTDGAVYMGGAREMKRFNIRDGLGLRLLQRAGIRVGWISNRPSPATELRAQDLRVDYLHQAQDNKVAAGEAILAQAGLEWRQVCYVGDDIVDLGMLRRAGLAVAVGDARPEARRLAHYVTRNPGGHGAVREIAELILKTQKKWVPLVADYST
ncbi:MAG: HAD-IIIA family hydrolase [Verrucomicrobia bacterium]|nr:HAD-IIIA family hydrolase [Verrucomicrobiota bacterium]